MDITYTKSGDYYLPNIALSDTTHYHIGKYGRMRRAFLQKYRPIQYSDLVLTEKLFPHLSGIDEVEKLDAHRETACENFTPVSRQRTPKAAYDDSPGKRKTLFRRI